MLTFLGATLFNLAAGQPFTPAQILWINFLVNAPFGVALGFDEETPGLMNRRPRPRGRVDPDHRRDDHLRPRSGCSSPSPTSVLIAVGKNHYGSIAIGQSIGLVAFSLMLVVAAFEARSETETVFTGRHLQQLADEPDRAGRGRRRLPHHPGGLPEAAARHHPAAPPGSGGSRLLAAVVLLLGWEAGKWIARRRAARPAPSALGRVHASTGIARHATIGR